MAYAEKVYKVRNGRTTKQFTWRACYKKPDGSKGTEPGFATKTLAVEWGAEQERLIKVGAWIDPEKRAATFGEFASIFMASRRKRGQTTATRWDKLELRILPRWKDVPLGAITWFDVDSWQQTMDVEDVSRGHCVSLMSTIMTGAVDAGYLTVNPLFGRRRTKDTSGDAARPKPPKIKRDGGVRPEDVIRIAERLGPARGIHVLTTAFTGMNWGEGLAVHRDNALLWRRQQWGAGEFACRVLRVVEEFAEYQLRDENGTKQGYVVRLEPTKNEWRTRDIDVPPFLGRLLDWHLQDWPHERLFATDSGKPWRRGNWSKMFRPVCDGRDERSARQGVAARAAWEPICEGLDMRSLRALHDTLQSELGVKEPLAFEAAGHKRPGIKAHYQRPTPAMRAARLEGLEAVFWEALENVGLKALWGRVDLVKHPEELIS
ncbi:hypothetical protein V2W30_22480 [Streptomyces sp. Q6]|uniref:Uncharacterized protein n=1 Tax=Streptomyces citrinus TaxID=3118173 RepID=A0ACD5AFG3_9ACTN